ncbi:hypothetical protein TUN199_08746 [Pyrenophora tritici-repentis]|nr:hypothetical protein PtrV1_07931 [Pyrenophora tritici-repentis]KAI0573120.1 hypothetical protein Alg215_09375 [Pyrenophora tritici-repentis]KAI0576506.1 hypothetical protein Alg130_08768 [Pyrenophora tritici-repentis]KAI0603769.1 hypothetical protein TUN205_11993 [Pyrenophora tritici-repentis]KAI0619271.1 hypothetical protein TUN199_08746 [Pyrenophora tritici-repentis]
MSRLRVIKTVAAFMQIARQNGGSICFFFFSQIRLWVEGYFKLYVGCGNFDNAGVELPGDWSLFGGCLPVEHLGTMEPGV